MRVNRLVINNFQIIDDFIEFEEGTYYKFELLVRNTDGANPLYREGLSNANKNILIKSWYIDSLEYYTKIKHEMITLANMTGARLYMTLDRKSVAKTMLNLQDRYSRNIRYYVLGNKCSIKTLSKSFASETSKVEASSNGKKTIMFDVDTTDSDIVGVVIKYVASKLHSNPYILQTKKGYHVFCYRKFDVSNWMDEMADVHFTGKEASKDEREAFKLLLGTVVGVNANELGLIYYNNERRF